ncbi:hypothetical protein FEZ40_05115 [Lacticaseibacillus paracasei]|nr:hypothetical protein EQH89_05450 [Lacticaseibacillus paracasei]TLQ37190.1 hypothetical protein FEZ40_05115 [Lacticaseibacillus paracasei]
MAKARPSRPRPLTLRFLTAPAHALKKPLHIGTVIPNLLLMIVSIPERSWRLETKRCAGRLRSGR